MKKLLLLLLLSSHFVNGQKLNFTTSLGWGYGLFGTGNFYETNNIYQSKVCYNASLSFSNFLANPQTGYFLDFRINDKHSIGIGRMTGITEHKIKIQTSNTGGFTYFKGMYRKLGLNYIYHYNRWNFQLGIFASNNKISTMEIGGTQLISVTKDSLGITKDSSFSSDFRVRKWGFTNSFGVGYTIVNKKKNRDRFVLNLLLDVGWYRLTGVKDYFLYDYNKSLTSYSYSNGSQLKVYISKPILLYDFKKDKYKLIN
jgi:hypothetical protein